MKRMIIAEDTAKTTKRNTNNFRSHFEEQLREMYWCEKMWAEKLPELAKLATSYELASAILAHLAVTENQIIRLIHVFDAIGERALGQPSEQVSKYMNMTKNLDVVESGYFRDVEIISCSQKMMQFEIAKYSKLFELASRTDEEQAAEYLALAIKEEQNAYNRLTEIELSAIYFDAAS